MSDVSLFPAHFPKRPVDCSSIQSAVSDAGFSRAGVAAAVAVPLVAIGSLALLSPLALGRKKRDLDAVEGEQTAEPAKRTSHDHCALGCRR